MRKGTVVIACLSLLLAGCGGDTGGAGSSSDTVRVELQEQGSGQSGTATLTSTGDGQTEVVVELESKSATIGNVPQPAHIHEGSCDDLNTTPAYPLTDVESGKSTTTVDVSLDSLRDAAYAINVHKSATELETYVACGDIGEGATSSSDDGY